MCDLELLGIEADSETSRILNDFCRCGCHISTVKLEVRSLEALKAACQRLGLEFREGQTHYAWFGYFVGDAPLPEGFTQEDLGKCEHALHVPGAGYEIGLVFRDGCWRLMWDSFGPGGLEAALGTDCNLLKQSYGIAAALLEAQRQGLTCWEEQLTDGAIKLHIQTQV